MFPWLWIFAPQTYWPLSGAVSQDLVSDAFFRGIRPGAGVPAIEREVFEQASYGKQLGWLSDVVVEAIDANALRSAGAREALASLRTLHARVERIKIEHRRDRTDAAIALLDRIAADSPDELRRVLQRYLAARALPAATPPGDR
jgi:hypothetical protein